jgi:hypothetical protein
LEQLGHVDFSGEMRVVKGSGSLVFYCARLDGYNLQNGWDEFALWNEGDREKF